VSACTQADGADGWVDAELARKGRSYERNQHFLRSAYRDGHDPAAPLDAKNETGDDRVSIAEDVSVLRIDHISTKSSLLGVWRSQHFEKVNGVGNQSLLG